MNRIARKFVALSLSCAALSTLVLAQATRPDAGAVPPRAAALLTDLDSPDAPRRLAATKALADLPVEAVPALQDALQSSLSHDNRLAIQRAIVAIHNRPIREKFLSVALADKHADALSCRKAYYASGRTNPKWDRLVDDFFDVKARGTIPPRPADLAHNAGILAKLEALGCTDPMMRAYILRLRYINASPATDFRQLFADIQSNCDEMLKTAYPPHAKLEPFIARLWALARYGSRVEGITADDTARAGAKCLEMLPAVIKEYPENSELPWRYVSDTYEGFYQADPTDGSYNAVNAILQKCAPKTYLSPLLQAVHFSKLAIKLHDQGATRGLAQAQALVREGGTLAWERNPHGTLAPTLILKVTEDDEEFDKWFKRATEFDPDNNEACFRRVYHLMTTDRKDEALTFARACADHDIPSCRVSLMLVEYHRILGAPNLTPEGDYFKDPDVFAEIQDVFERFFADVPDDIHLRCVYARYAIWGEKWDIAHQQFAILGDRFDPTVYAGKQQYDYARRKVEKNLKPAATEP